MHIAVAKVNLRLPENQSLKGKRRVLQSLIAHLKKQFNISIAEVDDNDQWQIATLGLAVVSNETRHLQKMLSEIQQFIVDQTGEFEVLKFEQELLTGF
jgi:uncharacterized protein YlxP (DUF503 family)